ncbi:MAG: PrsW family intramembrane metalloprotease [Nocardiaceae bacterium]|nr:PrsW family intramembrane metalloprotease [Nocardiaceae bacterium]
MYPQFAGSMTPAPLPGPPGPYRPASSGRALRIFTWIAMVCGALIWVLSMLVFAYEGPATAIVSIGLALLPLPIVLAVFMWIDRVEPEPGRYLLMAFGWGATFSVMISLTLEGALTPLVGETASPYLVAPVVEEGAKAMILFFLVWFRKAEFDGVVDGVVYAGFTAAGFAFTENILYIANAYQTGTTGGDGAITIAPGGVDDAVVTFVMRCVFTPFAHPLFTIMTGIGLGIAVLSRHRAVRVLAPLAGYTLAVALHALWNFSATFGVILLTYGLIMIPLFIGMGIFIAWSRKQDLKVVAAHLPAYAQTGWIAGWELPALCTLQGRKAARRWATAVYGKHGGQAMADLQQAATELAFLHRRASAGQHLNDFPAKQQELLARLTDRKRMLAPAASYQPFGVMAPPIHAPGPMPPTYQ